MGGVVAHFAGEVLGGRGTRNHGEVLCLVGNDHRARFGNARGQLFGGGHVAEEVELKGFAFNGVGDGASEDSAVVGQRADVLAIAGHVDLVTSFIVDTARRGVHDGLLTLCFARCFAAYVEGDGVGLALVNIIRDGLFLFALRQAEGQHQCHYDCANSFHFAFFF